MSFNIVSSLLYIHAVEVVGRAKIGKGVRFLLGESKFTTNTSIDLGSDRLRRACESKIVDLSTEKNFLILVGGNIYILLVSGGLEVEFGVLEDLCDVFFPTNTGFGMTLEGMLNGKNMFAIQGDVEAVLIPFGVLVVDAKKGGNGRGGGMCIFLSIATKDFIVE
jgi:hypothetical protein